MENVKQFRYLETVITFAKSGTLNQEWFKNWRSAEERNEETSRQLSQT